MGIFIVMQTFKTEYLNPYVEKIGTATGPGPSLVERISGEIIINYVLYRI
jgi:hypothetical protein